MVIWVIVERKQKRVGNDPKCLMAVMHDNGNGSARFPGKKDSVSEASMLLVNFQLFPPYEVRHRRMYGEARPIG